MIARIVSFLVLHIRMLFLFTVWFSISSFIALFNDAFYSKLTYISFWKNRELKTKIKMIEQFESVCKNTHLAVM